MSKTFEDLIAAVEKRAEEKAKLSLSQMQDKIDSVTAGGNPFSPEVTVQITDLERNAYIDRRKEMAVAILFSKLVGMAVEVPTQCGHGEGKPPVQEVNAAEGGGKIEGHTPDFDRIAAAIRNAQVAMVKDALRRHGFLF